MCLFLFVCSAVTVLYCTVLSLSCHCAVLSMCCDCAVLSLCCAVPYCTVSVLSLFLCCTVLYCTVLNCTIAALLPYYIVLLLRCYLLFDCTIVLSLCFQCGCYSVLLTDSLPCSPPSLLLPCCLSLDLFFLFYSLNLPPVRMLYGEGGWNMLNSHKVSNGKREREIKRV